VKVCERDLPWEVGERELTRTTLRAASAKSVEATPESHVPRLRARVDTILPFCAGRLSWRHRARPSTTLHETQACPLGAKLNDLFLSQGQGQCKGVCSEQRANASQQSIAATKVADWELRVSGVDSLSPPRPQEQERGAPRAPRWGTQASWCRCARNSPAWLTGKRRWSWGHRANRRPPPG
jgi:hypothetical protein